MAQNPNIKKKIQDLILINRALARGELEVLYSDSDEYVALRKGEGNSPGLVLYINRNGSEHMREVKVHWENEELVDYTGHIGSSIKSDGMGTVTLQSPGRSYAVWSLK